MMLSIIVYVVNDEIVAAVEERAGMLAAEI